MVHSLVKTLIMHLTFIMGIRIFKRKCTSFLIGTIYQLWDKCALSIVLHNFYALTFYGFMASDCSLATISAQQCLTSFKLPFQFEEAFA